MTTSVEQLRKELLAVVYRYSQESEITLSQTCEAFRLALESIGLRLHTRDVLNELYQASALLRLRVKEQGPRVTHFSDWERHTAAMKAAEEALK